MPDKPAAPAVAPIDHRIVGRIHAAIRDVSVRVVEDVTMHSEKPSFRDRASGDIFTLVVSEVHATTRPAAAPPKDEDGPRSVVDQVFDAMATALRAADPALLKDVARTDTGLTLVETATGKTLAVTCEKTGQKYQGPANAPTATPPAPPVPRDAAPPAPAAPV